MSSTGTVESEDLRDTVGPAAGSWRTAASSADAAVANSEAPAPWPLAILKSSQLDASRLDEQLIAMLREQLNRVFALMPQGMLAEREPELQALLLLMVFGLSVGRGSATPGSVLMNLRYRDERPGLGSVQRAAFGFGYVLLPYLWSRALQAASHTSWADREGAPSAGRMIWKGMRWAEGAYRVCEAANYFEFLRSGLYRSLLERLLRARLVYRQPIMTRIISFEYLNQQLVWAEMSELMLFLLPLLSTINLRRWVPRPLTLLPHTAAAQPPSRPSLAATQHTDAHTSPQSAGASAAGAVHSVSNTAAAGSVQSTSDIGRGDSGEHPSSPCPLCGSTQLNVPFVALPCLHVFCYYCLRASCLAEPASYCCPLDGVRVVAMKRWKAGRRGVQV
ncbi:MAG: hypothetical protein WDW38_002839 [Sanguina aurantia]